MEWFRFYADVANDPKVQLLPADLFRTWVNLLCLAATGSQRGVIRYDQQELSYRLHLTTNTISKAIEELVTAGLFEWREDGGALIPHNWETRQPMSDDSAQRTARYRNGSGAVTQTDTAEAEVGDEGDADFARFWVEYPRKTEKQRTRLLFKRWMSGKVPVAIDGMRVKVTADMLVSAARNYAASREGKDPKYTKMPSTFLSIQGASWAEWVNGIPEAEKVRAPEPKGFAGLRDYVKGM